MFYAKKIFANHIDIEIREKRNNYVSGNEDLSMVVKRDSLKSVHRYAQEVCSIWPIGML